MFRIIQLSDTHISPAKAHFAANWTPLAEWIAAQKPDLVIHTGDVTVDGADSDIDLRHCAGLLGALGVPFRAVPGNHDVGDSNHRHQPVNPERVARWNRYFGTDRWFLDVEEWRLVGLDAMLVGSGLPEEAAQLAWLDGVMAQAEGRRLAWFLHRPLFIDFVRDGTRYIWGPSAGFLVGPQILPPMPGASRLGAVRYEFDGNALHAGIVDVPGLTEYWIDDVLDEVYPAHGDTRPANTR
jgi:3',5'-cyclic AMP phosphodiesterase CpdA